MIFASKFKSNRYPVKHRRTRECPVCKSGACRKPGVPAHKPKRR